MDNELELLKEYERLTEACFINLYSIGHRNEGTICLKDFDPSRKEHRFLFELAVRVAGSMDMRIATNLGFWKRLKLYWPCRRGIHWISRKVANNTPTVDEMLEFALSDTDYDKLIYADIFDCFYGGN